MRVLIVDDSSMIRARLAERIVRIPGVSSVLQAPDGVGALAMIEADTPSLVVLDIQMPGLSGFGVLRSLRKSSRRPPVVVLTEHQEYHRYALDLGASYCFDKASQTEDVYMMIETLARASAEVSIDVG